LRLINTLTYLLIYRNVSPFSNSLASCVIYIRYLVVCLQSFNGTKAVIHALMKLCIVDHSLTPEGTTGSRDTINHNNSQQPSTTAVSSATTPHWYRRHFQLHRRLAIIV